jgi:hypothetical protein
MLAPAPDPASNNYSVEVSGWDVSESFFVETCELEWNEHSGKCIALRRMLHDGAHVFVRLLQPLSTERSYPIAYKAQFTCSNPHGLSQFRLTAVLPRPKPVTREHQ